MDEAKKGLLCPICDAKLSPSDKVCPSCNTDLALFGLTPEAADTAPQGTPDVLVIGGEGGDKIDALLREIEAEKGSKEAPKEAVEEKAVKIAEVFNCPECGTELPIDATQCSKCGVLFEEEAAAVCPLCGAVVDISATKCPSCGATFETEAPEPPPQTQITPEPPPVEQPTPIEEQHPPEPAEPPKEMSFVERMKMLRMQHERIPAPPSARPSSPKTDVKPPAAPVRVPPTTPPTMERKADVTPAAAPARAPLTTPPTMERKADVTPAAAPVRVPPTTPPTMERKADVTPAAAPAKVPPPPPPTLERNAGTKGQ
ncbi:MAG: zinc ribbon domain-containing protein, partial [Candidatus Thermoplasmatota archaeon]